MKRVLILLLSLLPASLVLLSCGGGPSGSTATTGIKYRAFISNSVSAGTLAAGVDIVDAQNDVRSSAAVISAGNTPGMMVVTPNRAQTLVFSGNGTLTSDNQLSFINNASEQNAAHVSLPGMTESFVVSPDSSTAYVAVPTAFVDGQPPTPGLVAVYAMSSASFAGQVAVPSVHYLSINNSGSRILGFSDNSDFVAVITPSLIEIGSAVTYIGGPGIFDRPIAAFFSSDDSTAYVLSCGAECGGTQASVQQFNLSTNSLVASVPACIPKPGTNPIQCASDSPAAGSVAWLNGSTMYLAGTPYDSNGQPFQPCTGQTTAAQTCGLLTIINLDTMSVTNTSLIIITDGYHNRIAMGANGQLFIGARGCTEIVPPVPPPAGVEVRGCLSIYNTLPTTTVGSNPPGGVLIPPANGDATGLQPIATRNVVYVVQGGSLAIYDATIDALEYNKNNPNNPGQINNLVGQFVDVKAVDF